MIAVRRRAATAGALALALSLSSGLGLAEAAKREGSTTKTFRATKTANATVPDAIPGGARSTPLRSTIIVPKKAYWGKVVGDVNVTGVRTTGSVPGAADDLFVSLTAPSGRTIDIFTRLGDQSLGPWTIDDDTATSVCPQPVANPCPDSTRTLHPPFAGTANSIWNFAGQFPTNGAMASFNRVRMRGKWTLQVSDLSPSGDLLSGTSVLDAWGLEIAPAKPVSN